VADSLTISALAALSSNARWLNWKPILKCGAVQPVNGLVAQKLKELINCEQ